MVKRSLYCWITFEISLLLVGFWLVLVNNTRSVFLNSRITDPLAMIHALFPSFWLLLLAFLCLSIAVVVLSINNKWIHILLLLQMSLILYYTPLALSGFSQNPDSLWHAAIGISMPDVLSGQELKFSDYSKAYPLSFILTNCITEVSGADMFAYVTYIYPIFSIAKITFLGYVLASQFLDRRNAFISMLFALPALHYLPINLSPRTDGFYLALTVIVFLAKFERRSTAVALSLMFLLIFTHTTSPLIVGIFLFTIYIYKLFTHDNKLPFSPKSILILGIGWLSWLTYHVVFVQKPAKVALIRIATLEFSKGLRAATELTKLGGGFVYPEISVLNQVVYISYLTIAITALFFNVTWLNFKQEPIMWLKRIVHNLTYKKFVPIISAFLYIVLSYSILLGATQNYEQLQRALPVFILMISIFIGSHNVLSQNVKSAIHKRILVMIWLVFLFLSFPIISYSKEAYNTIPPSDGVGMNFIESHFSLEGKKISIYAEQQLIAYVSPFERFLIVNFPPDLNKTHPDIIVLRNIGFFRIAMRFDLSFETNRFTLLQDKIKENNLYNKVYSSPTLEIYVYYEQH